MKKTLFVTALLCAALLACAVPLAAQEVPGTSASTRRCLMDISKYNGVSILNAGAYSKQFLNKQTNILDSTYAFEATDEDFERIASLGGDKYDIDTAEEIALLSAATGVINVRPVEAAETLPASDPVLIDLQLGAMLYMKKAAVTFLSDGDPARYAAELKFITDRSRVTAADINNFMVQGISTEVDKQFKNTLLPPNEIKAIKDILTIFFVRPDTTTFNAVRDVSFIYNETSMALSGEKRKAYNDVRDAYDNTLRSLCFGLLGAIEKDIWGNFDFKSGADNVITLASMVQQ
jgi:hypothetical protein